MNIWYILYDHLSLKNNENLDFESSFYQFFQENGLSIIMYLLAWDKKRIYFLNEKDNNNEDKCKDAKDI